MTTFLGASNTSQIYMGSAGEGGSVREVWFKHFIFYFLIVNQNIPTDNDKTFLGASNTS